jgi:hypothetical protein
MNFPQVVRKFSSSEKYFFLKWKIHPPQHGVEAACTAAKSKYLHMQAKNNLEITVEPEI